MIAMGEHTCSAKRAGARLRVIAAGTSLVFGGVNSLDSRTPGVASVCATGKKLLVTTMQR